MIADAVEVHDLGKWSSRDVIRHVLRELRRADAAAVAVGEISEDFAAVGRLPPE